MKFTLHRQDWQTIEQGEQDCFLMTNGLGGYSSLSVIGSLARGDEALLMSAQKAPNVRWHLVSNILETFSIEGRKYTLTSQRMGDGKDLQGFELLETFSYDGLPEWIYRIEDVIVRKSLIMVHGENTVAIRYLLESEIPHKISFTLTPLLRFSPKKESFSENQDFIILPSSESTYTQYEISGRNHTVYVASNAKLRQEESQYFGDMYFSQDERDGREAYGKACCNHSLVYEGTCTNDICVIFSTRPYEYHNGIYEELLLARRAYDKSLLDRSFVKSDLGKQLTLSADAFVVDRESTHGKSIIAGYPFFEDWGRDTMIALAGITLVTGRFEECRCILETFARYEKKGLLPNLFPEGDEEPMYNSVDAPLLFINAVYEYIQISKDSSFLHTVWEVLMKIMTSYEQGTDYHIGMDEDGLICAGDGLEQLTWMDVRVGDYLPTPRHGKPVEVNAYWYNALCIMEQFACSMNREEQAAHYKTLSAIVKESFLTKFWNEKEHCLKDVLSGTEEENQVRCNQIWVLSLPYTMLPQKETLQVLLKVREELYTTIGLRTLSPKDPSFHEIYIGEMQERDRAYHQGTVWAFPLGAYYRAWICYLKQYGDDEDHTYEDEIDTGLRALEKWLREGCLGQIAEIYDGAKPTVSRGCYAQAWSVGELLRAVYDWEQYRQK